MVNMVSDGDSAGVTFSNFSKSSIHYFPSLYQLSYLFSVHPVPTPKPACTSNLMFLFAFDFVQVCFQSQFNFVLIQWLTCQFANFHDIIREVAAERSFLVALHAFVLYVLYICLYTHLYMIL